MDLKDEIMDDVLLADEGNGKMNVVAGLNEKGGLKTVAPKQVNELDFMKIDKSGNVLDNFLTNYFQQASNPKHTGFYRVAKEGIEGIADVISNLIKSGGDEGEEFLKEYKVDTSKYERQDVDISRGAEEVEKPQEQKREYKAMSVEQIDWEAFSKIGISRESLEKSKALDSMLNYRRSPNLHTITMKVEDLTLHTDARLSLRRTEDGRLIPVIHAVRKAPELERAFYGNTFTAEDKKALLKTGNLGRTLHLNIKGEETPTPAFVSIDPMTNELVAYNTKSVRIPNKIKGVELDERQKQELLEGRAIYLEGMTSKGGKEFNAMVQINAAERGITFRFDEQRQSQKQTQEATHEGVRIPSKIGGVELSEQDRTSLKSGDVIYVKNLTDKRGEKYDAYIKVNQKMGKLDFYKWDPRKRQDVTADRGETTQSRNEQSQQSQSKGRKI